MQIKTLGRSGLKVTEICLGTATFGNQADEGTSFSILDKAADAGVNFIDTANSYPMGGTFEQVGSTERIIGKWFKNNKRREDFVLASKVAMELGPGAHQRGLSRKHIIKAVEDSLKRLNTDYIDLYQAHRFDPATPLEETLRVFDDLVSQGKVRYIGVSNWRAWQTAKAIMVNLLNGYVPIVSTQPRYNLLFRMIEEELVPLCMSEGIGIITFNPLAGGLLTGRYDWNQGVEKNTRFALTGSENVGKMYQERYWNEHTFNAVDLFRRFCEQRGYNMAASAIKWGLEQPGITSTIVGASRPEQLENTLQAVHMNRFTEDELLELDQMWIGLPRRKEER